MEKPQVIKLAMELPTSKLKDWSPLADLDFILAHQVLEDRAYAEFFKNRPKGRELILDNSLHELGFPLPVSDLLEAANRVDADYTITPDRVGNVAFNIDQFAAAKRAMAGRKLAVVMTGSIEDSTWEEREEFLSQVRDADMLCCTFKLPERLPWYMDSFLAKRWMRVHLLGVDELYELQAWQKVARHHSDINWSVDTAKPLKWAMCGKTLDEVSSLRKAPLHSKDLLNLKAEDLTEECERLFRLNVERLKEHL